MPSVYGRAYHRHATMILGNPAYIKYGSLLLLALQNAALVLVMRYVRTRKGEMFLSTSAVVMSEMCKFIISMTMIFLTEGASVARWLLHLKENIIDQPMDCVKISVPSIVYTLQNNLLYLAVSNLEAATFQVTYQLKILTTALFSVIMLRKELSKLQWVSLVILFAGVSTVQLQGTSSTSAKAATDQNPLIGLVAVIVSCLMSGFAGVYFEKMLKGTKQTLWLRNVELSFLGMIIGVITMFISDGKQLREKGFFNGYDAVVWIVILLQSAGGLLVALVIKYCDNILKGFATSAAILMSCVASMYFFDFHLTLQFTAGAAMVMVSVYMYSRYLPKPKEIIPSTVNRI